LILGAGAKSGTGNEGTVVIKSGATQLVSAVFASSTSTSTFTLGDDNAVSIVRPAHASAGGSDTAITGQAGGGTNGAGGTVTMTAGEGKGTGAGGNLVLAAGNIASGGTGAFGTVDIKSGPTSVLTALADTSRSTFDVSALPSDLVIKTNEAAGLAIKDDASSAVSFITLDSTTANPTITMHQSVAITNTVVGTKALSITGVDAQTADHLYIKSADITSTATTPNFLMFELTDGTDILKVASDGAVVAAGTSYTLGVDADITISRPTKTSGAGSHTTITGQAAAGSSAANGGNLILGGGAKDAVARMAR